MRPVHSPTELPRIPEFTEHWTRLGLSSTAIDHAAAERALAGLCRAAGLAEPGIVWAPCPMTAMLSAIVYTRIRDAGEAAAAGEGSALADIVDRIMPIARVPVRMRRRMRQGIEAAVASALSYGDRVENGFAAADAIEAARCAERRRAFDAGLAPGLEARLERLVGAPVRRGIGPLSPRLNAALDGLGQGEFRDPAWQAGFAAFGGPRSLGDAAVMDYLHRVLGIELDRRFVETAARCGRFWILGQVCFAAERPTHLNRDEAGQLHCEVGPSLAYPSGWSCWHWHGVGVTQNVVEAPETITVAAIHRASGPERRRVMIERYRAGDKVHGIRAYLRDAGARPIDHDPGFGTLWHIDTGKAAPILLVEVENRTPEPDGSYRHFLLRVDPRLRPMHAHRSFGAPQLPTARNAVASTFGLTGADYAPEIET